MQTEHSPSQRQSPVSRQSAETHDVYFWSLVGTNKEYSFLNTIKKQHMGLSENRVYSIHTMAS